MKTYTLLFVATNMALAMGHAVVASPVPAPVPPTSNILSCLGCLGGAKSVRVQSGQDLRVPAAIPPYAGTTAAPMSAPSTAAASATSTMSEDGSLVPLIAQRRQGGSGSGSGSGRSASTVMGGSGSASAFDNVAAFDNAAFGSTAFANDHGASAFGHAAMDVMANAGGAADGPVRHARHHHHFDHHSAHRPYDHARRPSGFAAPASLDIGRMHSDPISMHGHSGSQSIRQRFSSPWSTPRSAPIDISGTRNDDEDLVVDYRHALNERLNQEALVRDAQLDKAAEAEFLAEAAAAAAAAKQEESRRAVLALNVQQQRDRVHKMELMKAAMEERLMRSSVHPQRRQGAQRRAVDERRAAERRFEDVVEMQQMRAAEQRLLKEHANPNAIQSDPSIASGDNDNNDVNEDMDMLDNHIADDSHNNNSHSDQRPAVMSWDNRADTKLLLMRIDQHRADPGLLDVTTMPRVKLGNRHRYGVGYVRVQAENKIGDVVGRKVRVHACVRVVRIIRSLALPDIHFSDLSL